MPAKKSMISLFLANEGLISVLRLIAKLVEYVKNFGDEIVISKKNAFL